ncbi:MAG: CoA transferase [Chloroflexi bacterium]|nr:CoA transferase [Chloroflexota bacterium]
MTSALSGIKVLDLAGIGPASFAAMMLGDMGADVLKINMPPGASDRGVGGGMTFVDGFDPGTIRNKKNIAINLKTEAGQRLFHQLAETTDIIIEAFRPGVMDRLGVGYEAISKINPKIIFCSVSGYGQDGPYRDLVGHDNNYAAMGGALGLIGYSPDDPPVLVQTVLADMTTGVLQSAVGILLAICAREKTGRGQQVDISLTDGVVFLLNGVPEAAEYLMSGVVPQRGQGIFGGNQPAYAVYQTGDDKYLTIGCLEPHFWLKLCQVLDREDLIPHQYAESPKKEEVLQELKQIFRTRNRDEWFELLSKADVPVGKVLDTDEVFSDPNVLHRRMVFEVDHPRFGKMKQIGLPIKLSDTPWQVRIPAASLGEHTDEVLSSLGYSRDDIDALRQERVIY